jgi:hypothetical protein
VNGGFWMRFFHSLCFLSLSWAGVLFAAELRFTQARFEFAGETSGEVYLVMSRRLEGVGANTPVTWQVTKLPEWLKWDSSKGIIRGTAPAEAQNVEFKVRAIQGTSKSDAQISILIKKAPVTVAKPPAGSAPRVPARSAKVAANDPVVLVDPLELPAAVVGKAFSFDLSSNVRDTSGAALVYRLVFQGNEKWLSISPQGLLSGTPARAGEFSFVVEISNSTGAVQNALQLVVADNTQPPTFNANALNFLVAERATEQVDLTEAKYITGASASLQFRLAPPVEWASVTPAGLLKISPRYAQVGNQTLTIEAVDGNLVGKGTAKVQVTPVPRVPTWKNAVRVTAKVGEALNEEMATFASDPDGRPLIFNKKSGPNWISVTAEGILVGTPTEADVGPQAVVLTASNEALSADGSVIVNVVLANRPPVWVTNPSVKGARVAENFQGNLNGLVEDPEGGAITFTRVSGPNWIRVAADGSLTGRPTSGDVGNNRVLVRATDTAGDVSESVVQVEVAKANAAPRWTVQEPFNLGMAQVGKKFSLSLADKAVDEDGDAVRFRIVNGPQWLSISPTNSLEGTAAEPLGNAVVVLAVSDGKKETQLGAALKVVPANKLPVIGAIEFEVDERRAYTINLNAPEYVSDPEGDPLTFSLGPISWADLSPQGVLSFRATFDQIGVNQLAFDVTDGKDVVAGTIQVTVKRVPRAPRWKKDPIELTATAGIPFSANLKEHAEDRDGLPITFERLAEGPEWLTVDAQGRIQGTPLDAHADKNAFVVVAKNDKLSSQAALIITVQSDNSAPVWRKPVTLPEGRSEKLYAQSMAAFASDPDPDDELHFAKVNGPAWGFITSSGLLIGTPAETDTGSQVFTVRVFDSVGASAETKVTVPIGSKNQVPSWTQEIVRLGNARVGVRYAFDLSVFASDADGDPLVFKKVAGPAWLLVAQNGSVSGIPRTAAEVGEFPVEFSVSDGKAVVPVDATLKVVSAVEPPKIISENLSFTLAPAENLEVELSDARFVTDPQGEALAFKLVASPAWVALSNEGKLTVSAPASAKGNFVATFDVTNRSGGSSRGAIRIAVDAVVQPPKWLEEPIELVATADAAFSADLKTWARDLGNLPLSFSKVSGPEWLSVNPDGRMGGRPTAAMVGQAQTFEVKASNSKLDSEIANVIITVQASVQGDRFSLADPVDGARADILFVVDHTMDTAEFFDKVVNEAKAFFDELDRAKVHYSVGVLSSRAAHGRLVWDSQNRSTFTSDEAGASARFAELIEYSRSRRETVHAPIHSMAQFFGDLKTRGQQYPQFFRPSTPLFVYVVAGGPDMVPTSQGAPAPRKNSADMAKAFVDFSAKARKPLQIFVNDMKASNESKETLKDLASVSGSVLYAVNPERTKTGLNEFASKVVAESSRYAVRGLALKRIPSDVSKLKVAIRYSSGNSVSLTGNQNTDTDQWRYVSRDNSVVLNWWNIRQPIDPSKDTVVVTYP